MTKKIAIIGAGLGGISAAIRLSRAGFSVDVFEKNTQPGGKLHEHVENGYRFDTGPSVLTFPNVIHELFYYAGFETDDFLTFIKPDPATRYIFSDSSNLDIPGEANQISESLENFSPGTAKQFNAFMSKAEKMYNRAGKLFLESPIHELKTFLSPAVLRNLHNLARLDSFKSMYQGIEEKFSDKRIRQLFARYATYNGSNPYQAPATLNMISYVEMVLGTFYVKGGMYRLAKAMELIGRQVGIHFYYNIDVEKIIIKNDRIKGIQINNDLLEYDYVISNVDVINTFKYLIDDYPHLTQKYSKLEPGLSGMVFLWGIDNENPDLIHHNVLFSADYRKEFDQLFKLNQAADDPTVYIAITSKTDPTDAPVGSENWFVMVNMPGFPETGKANYSTEKVRKKVLAKLKKSGFDIENNIQNEKILEPKHFAEKFGANRGSIYGISSNHWKNAFMRPANRSKKIDGLYFAGGSTHPGGGVPLVILSGKIVSQLIMQKEKIKYDSIYKKSKLFLRREIHDNIK